MNIKEIKDLINLMNENGLSDIEFENQGLKIRLRRNGADIAVDEASRPPRQAAQATSTPSAPPKSNVLHIKSPMVGTFYAAPAPDADPYIQVGSKISVGQVVCIIEAMKLMNEIKSEIRGSIAEIHVGNGEPVEFGQVLFTVAP